MIFVTTGTQVPFDRLVMIMDKFASVTGEEVIIQAFNGKYKVKKAKVVQFISPDEFDEMFQKARLIVAHAGIGTIVTALEKEKPLIVFPRLAKYGEHRNNHQVDTAVKMRQLNYVYVADTEEELFQLLSDANLHPLAKIGRDASRDLIDSVRQFIIGI
ncbi:MAG: glycosyl transferase family 28 [Paludibacteraceae bacterium]|nr:glycosyl transferase family 28 [Paludibacteraceae bacterium]